MVASDDADKRQGHGAPGGQAAMPADMAYEMGHGGKDLPAMVRDMSDRFWICLIFTIPIFVYAPMGSLFKPPALSFPSASRPDGFDCVRSVAGPR